MGNSTTGPRSCKKISIRVEIRTLKTWVLFDFSALRTMLLQIDPVFKKPASLVKPLCPLQAETF